MSGLYMGFRRDAEDCSGCGQPFNAQHGAAICQRDEMPWGDDPQLPAPSLGYDLRILRAVLRFMPFLDAEANSEWAKMGLDAVNRIEKRLKGEQ